MRPLFAMLALAVLMSAGFLLMGCASGQGTAPQASAPAVSEEPAAGSASAAESPASPEGGAPQSLEKPDVVIDITMEDLAVDGMDVELDEDLPLPELP